MPAASSEQGRSRRPQLTLEAVVEAAARVLAQGGYAGLTMRAIADDLGVQAPALYWYVPNKEALKGRLYEHLMAGFTVTLTNEDWREQIRQAARQLRAYMVRVRDISRLVPNGFSLGPNSMGQLEGGLGILLRGGLAPDDAARGFNLLFGYVLDWVEGEAEWREREKAGATPAGAPDFDPAEYPNLALTGPAFFAFDPDGAFEFGLGVIIAGLETRARAPSPTPPR